MNDHDLAAADFQNEILRNDDPTWKIKEGSNPASVTVRHPH